MAHGKSVPKESSQTYFIDNMHKILSGKRLLIHTSTMSVGVDYSEDGVFDVSVMYGVASSGQTGVDLLQQDMRVRHINDTVVSVFYSRAICSYLAMTQEAVRKDCDRKKASMKMLFDQQRKDCAWDYFKEMLTMNDMKELTWQHVQNMLKEFKQQHVMSEEVPEPLRELHESHTIDQSHWAAYYAPMFQETVQRMGHEYVEVTTDMSPYVEMLKNVNPEDYDDDDDEGTSLYDSIEQVTPEAYAELRRVQKAGNADLAVTLKIKKYIFDSHLTKFPRDIQQRITHVKRCKIFFLQHTCKPLEKMFLNMVTEFCDCDELLQNIATYRPYAMQIKSAEACLPHIRRICNTLGLLHTLDTHPAIPRSAIENNLDDLDHQCEQVLHLLGTRHSKSEEPNFNQAVCKLGTVFGHWSGMAIRDVKPDNKEATTELKLFVKDTQSAKIAQIIFSNF